MLIGDLLIDGPKICGWIGLDICRPPIRDRLFQPDAELS